MVFIFFQLSAFPLLGPTYHKFTCYYMSQVNLQYPFCSLVWLTRFRFYQLCYLQRYIQKMSLSSSGTDCFGRVHLLMLRTGGNLFSVISSSPFLVLFSAQFCPSTDLRAEQFLPFPNCAFLLGLPYFSGTPNCFLICLLKSEGWKSWNQPTHYSCHFLTHNRLLKISYSVHIGIDLSLLRLASAGVRKSLKL